VCRAQAALQCVERVALRQRIPALANIGGITHWVTRDTERTCGGDGACSCAHVFVAGLLARPQRWQRRLLLACPQRI